MADFEAFFAEDQSGGLVYAHFTDGPVDSYGAAVDPLRLYFLVASAYRDPEKEIRPGVTTALLRNALLGDPLPRDLLARAIRRNRVDRSSRDAPVPYARAALLKLILASQGMPMSDMESLNPNPQFDDLGDRTAYHCGRLLAELEAIQRAALGQVNATLTDRYYGAVFSTPANIFPSLLRGARSHLAKLRKQSSGTYTALDTSLESILVHLTTFPKTLSMPQQGLFALGFYHQRALNRAAAKAGKAAKSTPTAGATL
ncbi:MAG: type I-C CRISPR-associated protein Cas8c/Csd1 [Cyanobacteria bacterium P01_E01_bin.48]